MRKMTMLSALAALVAGGLVQTAAAEEDPITVGFAIAQSGWMQPYDIGPARMAELAIEEINQRGGLLGRQLVTSYADTKTDVAQSAKAGGELIEDGADFLVLSCDYDYGSPAALAAEDAGVVSMSTCAGDPLMGIQGVGPHTFTAALAAQVQGAVAAEWGYHTKGYRNAYVLLDTFIEFNKSVCAGFDWAWERLPDAKVAGNDTFHFNDPSIASQITRIKNSAEQPDVIMICSFPPGGATAIRQMRAAGIDVPILAGQGFEGNFWLESVPNLGEFYLMGVGSVYGNDPREKVREVVDNYKKKFNEPPVSAHSLTGYLVIEMWANAVEKAGTTEGAAVVAALESFRDEPTFVGPRTFTDELHIANQGTFLMLEVVDGQHNALDLFTNQDPVPENVLFRVKE